MAVSCMECAMTLLTPSPDSGLEHDPFWRACSIDSRGTSVFRLVFLGERSTEDRARKPGALRDVGRPVCSHRCFMVLIDLPGSVVDLDPGDFTGG
jgi:hypothetical protein